MVEIEEILGRNLLKNLGKLEKKREKRDTKSLINMLVISLCLSSDEAILQNISVR